MKIRNFIYVLFSLAFLFSCSDENLPSNNLPLANMQKPNPNNRIDMAEAINLVEEAIAFLDREHPSESKSSRAVNSVSILRFGDLKSSMMKSGEYRSFDISDTLAYIFNFGDSSGYVIISNDARIESPLLAFTENGSLVNGKTDNPGLKIFLERLEGYVLESIAKSGKSDDQKAIAVARKGAYSGPLDTIVRPLVTVEWRQGEPFNNNLEHKNCSTDNGRVLAGCAATAIAQIMSYWEYPASLGGFTYHWTSLKKYKHGSDFEQSPTDDLAERVRKALARIEVADLFQQIGIGVKMDYSDGCNGSNAAPEKVLAFLASKGFKLSGDLIDFNLASVKPHLQAHRPLIATGCASNNAKGKACHGWVIDGLATGTNSLSYYLHNNWGLSSGNGYFPSSVFDPIYGFHQYLVFQDVKFSAVYR